MKHQIRIFRVDYNSKNEFGGLPHLPELSSFDQITDIDQVIQISLGHFNDLAEAERWRGAFPKTYKARLLTGYERKGNGDIDFNRPYWEVFFSFNTFLSNEITGEKNESAIARRLKVIKKIKAINS